MKYRGRELNAVALWEQYVEFPQGFRDTGGFAPLVKCPNPDHHTDKKHFQVNLDQPLVHCFAYCGISGTYEHAIAMIKGVKEREARKIIASHTRIALGPTSQRKVRGADGRVRRASVAASGDEPAPSLEYETYLPEVALEYLDKRGIGNSSRAKYRLGWDSESRRIVIPADDERGNLRFLIKRAVREKDWPKYLYTEGFPKTSLLFGVCYLDRKQVSSHGLVLVEGSIDTIRMQSFELPTGGILGTGLSDVQCRVIEAMRPPRVYLMFDPDRAGIRNIEIAASKLTKVPLFVCLYPRKGLDPATLSRKEAHRSFDNALSLVAFRRRLKERGMTIRPNVRDRKESAYG